MKKNRPSLGTRFGQLMVKLGLGMRGKLIVVFLSAQVLALIILMAMALQQIGLLGDTLREIAIEDSSDALNASAVDNIERMSTDTALRVADFLYMRDSDILYLAGLEPSEAAYRQFAEARTGLIVHQGQ